MKQAETMPAVHRALLETVMERFYEYRSAYAAEWARLEHCEHMYRGDHWHDVPLTDKNEPRPVTPVIQSTVESVAADLMDRLPEAVIAPERGADAEVARVLEAVIGRNHDAYCYAREYRNLVHDLLVGGYAVQEIGYDSGMGGGLGGSFIRHVDNRSILFDPLSTDLQEGRAVIKLTLKSRAWLSEHYPAHAPYLLGDPYASGDAPGDEALNGDRRDTLLLLEYWWRVYDPAQNRHAVHMALIAGGRVLADSRDWKPEGYYAHGLYPFTLTPLFIRKGTPLGLGLVDMFEAQQRYSDKLDQIVMKNALMASHNKLLITGASGFDAEDLADWAKEVHKGESLGGVTWFSTPPLPAYLVAYIREMRENIRQESGANDFSRGISTGGVTAASAISALQEASAKRARMASRQMHDAFRDAVRMEVEVLREFQLFTLPVRIEREGVLTEAVFEAEMLSYPAPGNVRLPVEFLISVRVQQETRFTALAQNELALKMLSAGMLSAQQAVDIMVFDGKEELQKQQKEAEASDTTKGGANHAQEKGSPRIQGGKRA